MQSSKMSQNLQILIERYSQTKQIISLFSIVFATIQNVMYHKNQLPNLNGVFTKLKLK